MAVDIEAARAIAAVHKDTPGGLMPALHAIQDRLGHIPASAVPAIADEFNLSRAEVHGVVSYYHHFRNEPAGRHLLQVCRAEACQAMGADALLAHAQQRLGCGLHGTTKDGGFSLEAAYCLGLCASSPAVMVGVEVHARMTPKKLDALIDELAAHAPQGAAA